MPQLMLATDGVASILGKRLVALLVPVLATMLVVSWSVLNLPNPFVGQYEAPFFLIMDESSKDSVKGKIESSVVNALVAIGVVTAVTFLMVLLYRWGCEKILFGWLMLSASSVLFVMLGIWIDLVCTRFQIPYDIVTAAILLWNVAAVGLISIFYYSHPVLAQVNLILVSIVIACCLTLIPEWTAWSLLVAVAIYDVAAVLCPHGPLQMLVAVAEERNKPLPGFVYDSSSEIAMIPMRNYEGEEEAVKMRPVSDVSEERSNKVVAQDPSQGFSASFLYNVLNRVPFVLGLGDFIFYSFLCGRAAIYSFLPWMMSSLAVLLGLVGTLTSLVLLKGKVKALPALPISIFCGVVTFFFCRYIIVPFDWFATMSMLAL
ncbi:presenilin-like aspartic peptidase [Trypanosoma grayi]|uniref:presenilin-like aspartic peptidase n=1 Tax=Trypanosoma grayi TaxID=71804 RepID=UPI0004F43DDF|nr:presenilin-like aspartic peptidase [Trypanosoma grayi]KEG13903.1 presenilin-like aspartic peptidase [Trypanosoma grayi]